MQYQILLFIGIIIGVFAQISLKHGMHKHGKVKLTFKTFIKDVFKIYINIFVIIGMLSYFVSFLLWLIVLSKLDLSYAYPIVSINFALVALSSKIFFKERVSKKRWLSIFIIIIGVILVTLS